MGRVRNCCCTILGVIMAICLTVSLVAFWVFYYLICLVILGIFCIILALVSFIADLRWPDETADFFGNDVLQSYEDYFAGE